MSRPEALLRRDTLLLAAASRLGVFATDRHGGFSVWFAIMLVPLLILAGVGLDIGRGVNQKSQLQSAVDAAALAGAGAYKSAATLATATTVATNYMNNFKTSSGLTSLTFTVTPGTMTSGSSVNLYKMTVSASAPITNTLMSMQKASFTIAASATAQNPVYNIKIDASNFSSSAADVDTISWYIVPSDNSIPTNTNMLYSSASSTTTGAVTIQLTASDKIGFLLTNTTGSKPVTTCITILIFKQCSTSAAGYGSNQYGGMQGSTHLIYSHLYPPSKIAYPSSPTTNCSLQVLTSNSAPLSGSCSSSLPSYATVNCVKASGLTLYFYWNDMGGSTDDKDYNDATYTVTCSKISSGISKGLVLTN